MVESIILDFKSLLNIDENPNFYIVTEGPTESFEVTPSGSSEKGQMHVKFLHYTEKRAPSWYRGKKEVQDTLNHLIVACQLNRQVSICISDSRMRATAIRQIRLGAEDAGDGLGALKLLAAELLNAAFVKGPTRTVWLSGIHSRVPVKPDSKILTGLDLRDALDPLGDQSYYFTAARSRVPKLDLHVGVSPRGARVWVGSTCDWDDFVKIVADLLHYVETTTERNTKPLPELAVKALTAPALDEAYEIHFHPPELLADDPSMEPETKEKMERWAYRTHLEILKTDENRLEASVNMDDVSLGTLTLVFDTSDMTNVKTEATVTPPDPPCPGEYADYIKELEEVSQNARWIKVWYESGHMLTGGSVYEISHRDQQFDKFRWCDFTGYNIKKEKPNPMDLIGTKQSLFCWVWNNWPPPGCHYSGKAGWLACDDRPMEIADFIHLDTEGEKPILTQIHVKGSHSDSATRGISVADFHVVTSQAVKNLRFLDRLHMRDGLGEGLKTKIGDMVRHNGENSTRDEMLEAMPQIGTSYRRVVMILQPSVRKSKMEEVRKAIRERKKPDGIGRVRQLDTLLLDAQASCRNLGAELWVLADKT